MKPLPKIVICFSQEGCMATGLEFKWIGYVVNTYYKGNQLYPQVDMYDVQPIIRGATENRNYKKGGSELPLEQAWQIQHLGLNLYIHYI